MEKTCSRCRLSKPVEQFHVDERYRDGFSSRCKQCNTEYARERKLAHYKKTEPDTYIIRTNPAPEGYKWCRKCMRVKPNDQFYSKYIKDYLATYCKDCDQSRDTKYRYGVDTTIYNKMFEEQDGKCAICRSSDTKSKSQLRFHIDHNHKTGKLRALLCACCNRGIGMFYENIDWLFAAIEYLKFHSLQEKPDDPSTKTN
jgi:Recombination endonuclease VII